MSWGVRVTGLADLKLRLSGASEITDPSVVQPALLAGGEPVAEAARSIVRQRSGRLEQSIDVGTELSSHQADDGETGPVAYIGPASMAEAITEEFGTLHEAPHPYLRPAWEQQQGAAVEAIADALSAEFDQRVGG